VVIVESHSLQGVDRLTGPLREAEQYQVAEGGILSRVVVTASAEAWGTPLVVCVVGCQAAPAASAVQNLYQVCTPPVAACTGSVQ